ncbi:DUF2157 domain-containing protein [Ottowia thiooxydans]|uniref:Membrane protein n=1 Tax=Ottowia thiooxydans TaxID=219182 RepID=A0ABV2QFE6_9BURK
MNTKLYRAAELIQSSGTAHDADWRKLLYAGATLPPGEETLTRNLRRGLLIVAALLGGSGLIFWIAANWQELSRGARLAVVESCLLATLVAACVLPRAREACLVGAFLALGGLLAFIGQTYQTGADAWQLFAAWAALSLPWVLGTRSDLLWTPWVAVAALALSLWTGPLGLVSWFDSAEPHGVELSVTFMAWLVLGLLPLAVAHVRWLRLPGGVGRWSHRLALGLTLSAWTGLGLAGLFMSESISFAWPLAALLVAGVIWMSLRSRWRDLPTLALALLAANVLIMALAARLLFANDTEIGGLLVLGLLGLVCLGLSASWLMRQQQSWVDGEMA